MAASLLSCRIGRVWLVAGVCLTFLGCGNANVTRANYDKIQVGMTVDEVQQILGADSKGNQRIAADHGVEGTGQDDRHLFQR